MTCKLVMCRTLKEYRDGVEEFLKFAEEQSRNKMSTKCPCNKCGIVKVQTFDKVREHLICDGIIEQYNIWCFHGESIPIQVS